MNLDSVLQHESYRPIRLYDLCRRPAVGREAGIHRLDILRRAPTPTCPVQMRGQLDHAKDGRGQFAKALTVTRTMDSLSSLYLRFQFQVRGFFGWEADAVRLGGYLSLRFFQFTQPVFQVHLSPPIVPAAARNQQPRRLVAAPYPDSRACCRAWGPSSRPEYQPSFRPASALRPQLFQGRRQHAHRRRTPCGCGYRLCGRVRLLDPGLSAERSNSVHEPGERRTDDPLWSSLDIPRSLFLAA